MDFYKDFPERSDAGTATTPDGGIVAGSDKLNDNDYAMIGANGTGSNSQGKGYKVKFSSIYNYLKGKFLGDSSAIASVNSNGLMSSNFFKKRGDVSIFTDTVSENDFVSISDIQVGSNSCGFFEFEVLLYKSVVRVKVLVFATYNFGTEGILSYTENLIQEKRGFDVYFKKEAQGKYSVKLKITAYSFVPMNVVKINSQNLSYEYTYFNAKTTQSTESLMPEVKVGNDNLAASYIAERYSIDEEQSLTRRMIANDPTVVEQFEAYNAYCEECKTRAKEELANQPQVLPADELNNQTN